MHYVVLAVGALILILSIHTRSQLAPRPILSWIY